MWFFIGLITMLGAAAFFTYWRRENAWTGEQASLDNQRYCYDLSRNKGKVRQFRIGIAADTSIAFCLKQETAIDRFFKGIGLSEEQQLNRLHFDENIYVISDDVRLSSLLKYHPTLHKQLENVFEKGRWAHFGISKIWCQKGRLWIVATPADADMEDEAIDRFAAQVLPLLKELATSLQHKAPEHSGSKDFFIFKAALLLGISTALAVNGGLQLFRLMTTNFPMVLDGGHLLRTTIIWGGVALAILLFACIKLVGRTSRAHLVLIELFFVGGFGVFSSTYMELRDYNIEFDSSAPQQIATRIDDRYTTRCGKRKRSTCYHINLAPWSGQDKTLNLTVSSALYMHFETKQEAQIVLHQGALNVRWIEEPR